MKLLTIILSVFTLLSPNGQVEVKLDAGADMKYSVSAYGQEILAPSAISMTLDNGTVLGANLKKPSVKRTTVCETIAPQVYKKSSYENHYNQMSLKFKDFTLEVRAWDNGAAYRFVVNSKKDFKVTDEKAEYNFAKDWKAWFSYVRGGGSIEKQLCSSQENIYSHIALSEWDSKRIAFFPLMVEADGLYASICEADLRDYPGMYICTGGGHSLKGIFPAYPKDIEQGGHNMLQGLVKSREDFIAQKKQGVNEFPWRLMVIGRSEKEMLDQNLVYSLAKPAEDRDWSFVKPGKVAWDWWNAWNIYGVDFESGINNKTYEYYIDFASKNGIEYVILDEGWAVNLQADLFQVIPEIDLEHLVSYGAERNVGIILWGGYWAFNRDMEKVCKHYSEMGVKGFKVDFMDRDDQMMVNFYERAAAMTAKYGLLIDFHGAYKPTGLNRTYPNIINFEGVHGLEQLKWGKEDQVTYEATAPFLRMMLGPMDYTQGAMHNGTKDGFRPINKEPMSQGTRCRQLAEYIIFDAPLTMLCDSPSNYMREPECTSLIASLPTTWDKTVAVEGKISEYIIMAREKDGVWYIGAITDWTERDMTVKLDFLPEGEWEMDIFKDGVNARKKGIDYARAKATVKSGEDVTFHMAPGGGWMATLTRK